MAGTVIGLQLFRFSDFNQWGSPPWRITFSATNQRPFCARHQGPEGASSTRFCWDRSFGCMVKAPMAIGTRSDTIGRGKPGWVNKDDIRDDPVLKVFFVDVGQGDGAIVESPEGIMLVDGGPSANFYKFMKRRYRNILRAGCSRVRIKAMVMSHPDYDHFNGLTAILKDDRFTVGHIYHNGIIRYDKDDLPADTGFDLGKLVKRTIDGKPKRVLTQTYDGLEDAKDLIDDGHLMASFRNFWKAALAAKAAGRLTGQTGHQQNGRSSRLCRGNGQQPESRGVGTGPDSGVREGPVRGISGSRRHCQTRPLPQLVTYTKWPFCCFALVLRQAQHLAGRRSEHSGAAAPDGALWR